LLSLIFLDEMHIKEDLVYDKHTGKMIGFTDLGDINNHLLAYERSQSNGGDDQSLADSMLSIMVRGLFTTLKFAYVQFPCCKISGDLLFKPFWSTVCRLEKLGFKVFTLYVACVNAHFAGFGSHI
jgi:hypothetical protein